MLLKQIGMLSKKLVQQAAMIGVQAGKKFEFKLFEGMVKAPVQKSLRCLSYLIRDAYDVLHCQWTCITKNLLHCIDYICWPCVSTMFYASHVRSIYIYIDLLN